MSRPWRFYWDLLVAAVVLAAWISVAVWSATSGDYDSRGNLDGFHDYCHDLD